jgi:hypothetical protein
MWLVSTLLVDHWFESLSDALACYNQSPKTRTYPRLEARAANTPAQPFEYVYR